MTQRILRHKYLIGFIVNAWPQLGHHLVAQWKNIFCRYNFNGFEPTLFKLEFFFIIDCFYAMLWAQVSQLDSQKSLKFEIEIRRYSSLGYLSASLAAKHNAKLFYFQGFRQGHPRRLWSLKKKVNKVWDSTLRGKSGELFWGNQPQTDNSNNCNNSNVIMRNGTNSLETLRSQNNNKYTDSGPTWLSRNSCKNSCTFPIKK